MHACMQVGMQRVKCENRFSLGGKCWMGMTRKWDVAHMATREGVIRKSFLPKL